MPPTWGLPTAVVPPSLRGALVAGILAVLPVFVDAAPTPTPVPVDSDALVRIALEAPKHISYVGQLQTIRWGNKTASATVQRIEHLAPAQTRRTFLAPEALYGEYDVTDGALTRKFDTKRSRVLVTESPSFGGTTRSSDIALLVQNYRAVIGPVGMVASRPATTIWLVNRYTGERSMRLWIDNETKVVLAKEAYRSDGSLAWRMRYDDIRFTAEIPRDVFSTSVPEGFRFVESRRFADVSTDLQRAMEDAGFKAVGPRYLPDGFSIIGADVSVVKGIRNLHFLYSDGIRTISLFENNANAAADFGALKPTTTRFEGHSAEYVRDGPTTLIAWREHGLAFALVGDLDLRELVAIATSVMP